MTSTGFLLSWASPQPEDRNGIVRNYTIAISELNTGNMVQLVSQTTSQVFDSLHPYYNYSVQVAAVTVALGPFSSAFTITTLEDSKWMLYSLNNVKLLVSFFCVFSVPSGSPQNLVVTAMSSRSLRLTWEPPFEENRNGIITGYTISITNEDGVAMEITATNTSAVVTNLRPFTTYTSSITASTSVGEGPPTATVSRTTPEDGELH